jgi:hypothetical protein
MNKPRWLASYLHPGEQVIHLLYHSWVMVFGTVAGCSLVGLAPILAWFAFPEAAAALRESPLAWLAMVLGASLFYLGLLLFLLIRYTNYHLDFWIITSERLISVEQEALFTQRIAEQELGAIQDITSEINGLWATILNFGDVQVRTASERPPIIIDDVRSPHVVRRELFKLMEQRRGTFGTPPGT